MGLGRISVTDSNWTTILDCQVNSWHNGRTDLSVDSTVCDAELICCK